MDKYKAQDRLHALAEGMRMQFRDKRDRHSIVPQGVWVSLEDAVWLIKAIRQQSRGSTLDQALGLTGGPGRRRDRTNDLLCQTWAQIGAPLDVTPEQLDRIAIQACRQFRNTFLITPTARQVRRAIYTDDGGFTREAIEALAQALAKKIGSQEQK